MLIRHHIVILFAALLFAPLPCSAVSISPHGIGQVLIYPYYTVRGGNDTLISLVNTTDDAKAVKIRFREAWNSREVLDFNIYMDARDTWVAAITDIAGVPNLIVPDATCTVPYFWGDFRNANGFGEQDFLSFNFTGPKSDGGPQTIDRSAEGFIEVIEMGVLDNSVFGSAQAVEHLETQIGIVPSDCNQLVSAWSVIANVPGYWLQDLNTDMLPPTGGLMGQTAIINPTQGLMITMPATALINFHAAPKESTDNLHTNPGDEFPDLNSGNVLTAELPLGSLTLADGVAMDAGTIQFERGVDAVSAALMKTSLINEFNLETAIGASSEWVFSFPTRQYYTDPTAVTNPTFTATEPLAPFGQIRDETEAFDEINVAALWSRTGAEFILPDTEPDCFLVTPCPDLPPELSRYKVNRPIHVLTARMAENENPNATVLASAQDLVAQRPPGVTTIRQTFGLHNAELENGYAEFTFLDQYLPFNSGSETLLLRGMPVLGFWLQTFTNGTLENNSVLANYAGIFPHRSRTAVEPMAAAGGDQ